MDPTTQAHVDPATNPFAGSQQPTLGNPASYSTGSAATGTTGATGFQGQTSGQGHSLPSGATAHSVPSSQSHAVPAPVPTPAEIKQAALTEQQHRGSDKSAPAAAGIRQRVNRLSASLEDASGHPAVQNAKEVATRQTQTLRQRLGRSQTVLDLERRTGVDRVVLVVGGVISYILLIPLNIFRLALPTTQFLTILPAAYLAGQVLEAPETTANDDKVKSLLSFFVVLGAIQTLESLMAGFLEKRIPQYYTVKLLFLAYLLHPRTQGAKKVYETVLRPVVKSRNSPLSESYVPPTTTTPSSTGSSTGATSLRSSRPAGTGTSATGTSGISGGSGLTGGSSALNSGSSGIAGTGTSGSSHPALYDASSHPQTNPFAPSSTTNPVSAPGTTGLATSKSSAPQIPTLAELQSAVPSHQAETGSGLEQSGGSAAFPPPRVQAQQALAHAVHESGVPTASGFEGDVTKGQQL
ncbi:hypothetical protein IAT38_006158 [Cryptococcus sp. DSM 104549]